MLTRGRPRHTPEQLAARQAELAESAAWARAARAELRCTQAEIAAIAWVTKAQVSAWECGIRVALPSVRARIEAAILARLDEIRKSRR